MSSQLRSRNGMLALALVGALVVAAAVWLLGVRTQQSKASKLDEQISFFEQQIAERRAALTRPSADVQIRASDSYRLSKAMPPTIDMPGIILVLNRLAAKHQLTFSSIQPSAPIQQTGFAVHPLSIVVQGRFAEVSGFLADVRRLVNVQRHKLAAHGRLFSVDQFDLGRPDDAKKNPNGVKATLTVNAYTFNGVSPAPAAPSTPAADSGTVAAGATP